LIGWKQAFQKLILKDTKVMKFRTRNKKSKPYVGKIFEIRHRSEMFYKEPAYSGASYLAGRCTKDSKQIFPEAAMVIDEGQLYVCIMALNDKPLWIKRSYLGPIISESDLNKNLGKERVFRLTFKDETKILSESWEEVKTHKLVKRIEEFVCGHWIEISK